MYDQFDMTRWLFALVVSSTLPFAACDTTSCAPDVCFADATAPSLDAASDSPKASATAFEGRWALYGFEDPVGVILRREGSVIVGTGCVAGLPDAPDVTTNHCAPIEGTFSGNRLQFAFLVDGLGVRDVYRTDVVLSESGSRMVGIFEGIGGGATEHPVVWLRVPDGEFTKSSKELPSLAKWQGKRMTLPLTGTVTDGLDFQSNSKLAMVMGQDGTLYTNLGSFGGPDAKVISRMIVVGGKLKLSQGVEYGDGEPTLPRLATRIFIATDMADQLVIEVSMPSGGVYMFSGGAKD